MKLETVWIQKGERVNYVWSYFTSEEEAEAARLIGEVVETTKGRIWRVRTAIVEQSQ